MVAGWRHRVTFGAELALSLAIRHVHVEPETREVGGWGVDSTPPLVYTCCRRSLLLGAAVAIFFADFTARPRRAPFAGISVSATWAAAQRSSRIRYLFRRGAGGVHILRAVELGGRQEGMLEKDRKRAFPAGHVAVKNRSPPPMSSPARLTAMENSPKRGGVTMTWQHAARVGACFNRLQHASMHIHSPHKRRMHHT